MKTNRIYVEDNSALASYLKDINKYPIYPPEVISELIRKAQEGDIKARNKVVESHLRFVIKLAKPFQHRGIPLIDLINEGNMGLMYAIDKYDFTKGVPFINYSVYWIKQFMHQAVYWVGKEIRLPVSQHLKIIKLIHASAEFEKTHNREPSVQELTAITKIDEVDIDYLTKYVGKLISIDDYIGGDTENSQLGEIIPDPDTELDKTLSKLFLSEEIHVMLDKIPVREHDVLCLLFGINVQQMSLYEVGELYGIVPERIRQIRDSAFKRLLSRYGKRLRELR